MPPDSLMHQSFLLWSQGNSLEAGKLIFDNISPEQRPEWCADVLAFSIQELNVEIRECGNLLQIARNDARWHEAKSAFEMIRRNLTLNLDKIAERSSHESLILALSCLAENVTKVVYNAGEPVDPFDEDSGWWIASCLRSIVDLRGDESFTIRSWEVLCRGRRP